MSPTLHAKLNRAIRAVIDEESESGKRDFWIYDTLVDDMAHAARMIYDACRKGSNFTADQVTPE